MTNRHMLLGVESAKGGARRVQKKSRSTTKAATDRTENGRATDQKDRNKELELGTDMAFESRIPQQGIARTVFAENGLHEVCMVLTIEF